MRWIVSVCILLLAAASLYFFVYAKSAVPLATSAATSTPALTATYSNAVYGFTLMMPADFTAHESPDTTNKTDSVVLQNQQGDGIQILISLFDEDSGSYTLTKDRILQDVPDLTITNEQPVNVGANYQGLAFKSDNPAFDGDSREVWFVFHGHLYQISTYGRLDPLLQAIFKTWQFN